MLNNNDWINVFTYSLIELLAPPKHKALYKGMKSICSCNCRSLLRGMLTKGWYSIQLTTVSIGTF